MRRSVAALRDSPLQNCPLAEAVAHLVGECRDAGILTEVQISGTPRSLSPQAELTLYRTIQRGLR
ncbi:MAG: hypothetical protein M1132_05495 [Chloroflexi bacterium]|nr:hypothetical protein [Chloroflexota bacterium]